MLLPKHMMVMLFLVGLRALHRPKDAPPPALPLPTHTHPNNGQI